MCSGWCLGILVSKASFDVGGFSLMLVGGGAKHASFLVLVGEYSQVDRSFL